MGSLNSRMINPQRRCEEAAANLAYLRALRNRLRRNKQTVPTTLFEALLLNDSGDETFTERPCSPTTARPGSDEKIEVLSKRVERGQWLHHDDDVQIVYPPPRGEIKKIYHPPIYGFAEKLLHVILDSDDCEYEEA